MKIPHRKRRAISEGTNRVPTTRRAPLKVSLRRWSHVRLGIICCALFGMAWLLRPDRPWALSWADQPLPPETSANTPSTTRDGAGHAAAQGERKNAAEGRKPDLHPDRTRPSGIHHPPGRVSPPAVNRARQVPNRRQGLQGRVNARIPDRRPVARPGAAAMGGALPNKTHTLRAPPSSPVRPAGVGLNNVAHRGPNPAIVSGTPNARRRNPGVIDGSHIGRKP